MRMPPRDPRRGRASVLPAVDHRRDEVVAQYGKIGHHRRDMRAREGEDDLPTAAVQRG